MTGRLVQALGSLLVALERTGIAADVLTTNYDHHLRREIDDARLVDRASGTAIQPQHSTTITYLHGEIPVNGKIVDYPVISEIDYATRNHISEETLVAAFEERSILIIGAGLSDPPLVAALAKTRGVDPHLKRVALIPRSDLHADIDSDESRAIIETYDRRLSHLGVEGLYVDHYSQVSQFITELELAFELAEGTQYATSKKRYGERLNTWWSQWFEQFSTMAEYRDLQRTPDLLT